MKLLVIFLSYIIASYAASSASRNERYFPEDFIFGAATAAYQIEGAWDKDGKSESIWDHMTHTNPEYIVDLSNADIAADSYHNYKRDVEMMRELGLQAYRFSISWSRLLPSGFPNHVNPAAVEFYNDLINELLKYNIEPMVTLYHWDLPQSLQDLGGFVNPLIAEWFEDYARVCYQLFGDRVKQWITINEPKQVCQEGYGIPNFAPRVNGKGTGEYLCAKYLVLAHARAYHLYYNEFKDSQNGIVGFTCDIAWFIPLTDSKKDEAAAELKRQAEWGLYTNPIYSKEGGFPKELKKSVDKKSKAQGYPRSRMPEFTEEERHFVLGTADFFGINHYSTSYVSASKDLKSYPVPSLHDDVNVGMSLDDAWHQTVFGTMAQADDSLYNSMQQVKDRYGDLDFFVTENGFGTSRGLIDEARALVFRKCLSSVLNAIDKGIKVKGYMAWSLLDNFEWTAGYVLRFGIYEVDFEDPARTRSPRKSAYVYKHIIKTRTIDPSYEPNMSQAMTIDEGH